MKVLFLSYSDVGYSRSAVYFSAKNLDKTFIRVAPGLFNLLKVRRKIQEEYEHENTVLVVMSPSHLLAFYLGIFTNFIIVLDAGWPLSDSAGKGYSRVKNFLIDYLAFNVADAVILESLAQVKHSQHKFKLVSTKLHYLYTGINELEFKDEDIPPEFTKPKELYKLRVLFRGKNNKEAGLDKIVACAYLVPEAQFVIATNNFDGKIPQNVLLITRLLSTSEISWLYQNSDCTLGQFGENNRLNRTIPHKLFESMYFGKCYLSPPHSGIMEVINPSDFVEVVPNEALQLAQEIKKLQKSTSGISRASKTLRSTYMKSYSQNTLSERFLDILESIKKHRSDQF